MTHLKIGDKAPELNINNQDGALCSLQSFKGKKIVLYFYPKDSTPGCTAQACNLRDNLLLLQQNGFEVLGISPDSEKSHQKFIKNKGLNFSLLADINKEVAIRYGVWGEKKFLGKTYNGIHRTTFIINENGVIEKIITEVKTKEHTKQII